MNLWFQRTLNILKTKNYQGTLSLVCNYRLSIQYLPSKSFIPQGLVLHVTTGYSDTPFCRDDSKSQLQFRSLLNLDVKPLCQPCRLSCLALWPMTTLSSGTRIQETVIGGSGIKILWYWYVARFVECFSATVFRQCLRSIFAYYRCLIFYSTRMN